MLVNPIKRGAELNLKIDSLTYGGKGISKYNGLVIFTNNVLPGQTIKAKIVKKKKNFLEAIPLEIIEESPFKQKEKCNHFNDCGGCKTQDLLYSEQINQKENQIIEALTHLGKINVKKIEPIIQSELIYEYRNKMEFSFSNSRWLISNEKGLENEKPKDFALGLHPLKRFDKIVDLDNCEIQTKLSNKILNLIKKQAIQRKLIPYDIINHTGFIRNIIIKHPKYSDEVMINFVTAYEDDKLLMPIVLELKKLSSNIKSIINTINDKKSDSSYGMPQKLLYGENFIVEYLNEFKFEISADSFFQTNSTQALKMYEYVKNECNLTGSEIVYDFYCGTGSISIFVAKNAKKVYGFEIIESAIKDAKKNALKNNVENTEFYCGDLSKMLTNYYDIIQNNPCDILILDPPRAGLHPKTLKEVLKINPKKIIYVSCNPTTQARDVREFVNSNYIMGAVQPIDMFPHTHHIECVITLDRL
jgi:23S rRNA (uracil1939-C5)-methyltransferase